MPTVEQILMSKGPDVIVSSPDDTVYEAARLMAEGRVGSVIIQDGSKSLGIFTERDLLVRVVAKGCDPATTLLSKVMTSPVKTCRLADDIAEVGNRMAAEHIRHLAVVEDDALVGLISLRDVLSAQLRDRGSGDG